MRKKITAVLIIFAITAAVLYSCASDGDADENNGVQNITETGNNGAVTGEAVDETIVSDDSKILPDLPEMDLGGQVFNFYVMGRDRNVNNYSVEIYAEELTGDTINDAVFLRNKYIEEKYNLEITEFPETQSSLSSAVRGRLMANEDIYQVLMMNLRDSAALANEGLLVNLRDVEHIDFNKPWWDKASNDGFSIANQLNFAVGDINIMDNNATWAVFFNKKLISELDLELPYVHVRNNEWTLDTYHAASRAAAQDLNGDGIMDPDDDRWGTVGDYLNTFMLFIASGETVIRKNNDDLPYFEMLNSRSADVLNKVMDIQLDRESTVHANEHSSKYANVYSDMVRRNFREDRSLFYIAGLLTFTLLRDMESEFGMVPMPKLDSAQDNYYTTFNHSNASALSIPVTNAKLAETGLLVEALSAESMYTLTPAYFEVALERKYMRDEESRDMLEIILSTRMVDLTTIYDWGGAQSIFETLTQRSSRNFTSEFERIQGRIESGIESTAEKILSFDQ